MSTSLGELVVNFGANLTGLQAGVSQVKSELNQVEETANRASSNSGNGFTRAVGGVLDFGAKVGQTVFGLQALGQSAIGFANALLQPNASMEQTTVAFETLLGKGQKTQAFLQQMKDFAAATPFEFPEVATAAQHMLAFGFSAQSVIPTLTNIGDAMGSMGKGSAEIDHMVEIFGQMHAAGKLNAGDMMQISQMGVPAWKMLADSMGKTVPEVQKLSSQGLIPADKAIQAVSEGMHKMFGGGMAAQATTFNGLLSTLQDNASAAMRAFTGPLFDMAKSGLTVLGNLVSGKQFQDFATTMGTTVGNALKAVAGFVMANVVPAFQSLGPIIGEVGAYLNGDDFQAFIADVQTLGNQLARMLVPAFQSLAPYIPSLSQVLQVLGGIISGIVVPALDNIVFPLSQFFMFLNENRLAMDVFKAALIGIGVGIAAIQIGSLISAVGAVITAFAIWAPMAITVGIANVIAFWPIIAVVAAIAIAVAGIILVIQHWGEIAHWLQGVWGAFSGWFMGVLGAIGNFFVNVWNGMINWFKGAWGGMGAWFQGLWGGLSSGAVGAWNGLISGIQGIINAGVAWLQSIWQGAVNVVVGRFQWMYNHNYYFKDLVDFIVKTFTNFRDNAIAIWNGIVAFFTGTWNTIAANTARGWNTISSTIASWTNNTVKFLDGIWNAIASFFVGIWNQISANTARGWNTISSIISSWTNTSVKFLQGIWNGIVTWVMGIWNQIAANTARGWATISGIFGGAWNTYIAGPLGGLWNQFAGWFGKLAGSFASFGSQLMQSLAGGITGAGGAVGNAIHSAIGNSLSAMGFHGIPGFASGVQNFQGGWAVVGEKGPELVMLPGGSSVYPVPSSTPALLAAASSGGGSTTHIHNHLYIDGRELSYAMVDHVGTALVDRIRTEGPVGKVA